MIRFLKAWLVLATVLSGVLFNTAVAELDASTVPDTGMPVSEAYERAVVLGVENIVPKNAGPECSRSNEDIIPPITINSGAVQRVRLRVDEGPLQGQIFTVDNILSDNPAFNMAVKAGSRVIVSVDTFADGRHQVYLADLERSPLTGLLFSVFLLALLFVGGRVASMHFLLSAAVLWLAVNALVPALTLWEGTSALAALLALLFVVWSGYFLVHHHIQKVPLSVFVVSTYACLMLLMLLMLLSAWLAPLEGHFDVALASLWFSYPNFDYNGLLHTCAILTGIGFLFYFSLGMIKDAAAHIPDDLSNTTALKQALHESGRERLGPLLALLWLTLGGVYLPLVIQVMDMHPTKLMNMESVSTVLVVLFNISIALIVSVPLMTWLFPLLLQQDYQKRVFKNKKA